MTSFSSPYFKIQELVPQSVYDDLGEDAIGQIDKDALTMLHRLRQKFGPITVNDWLFGGKNHYRGFRPSYCEIGAKYSQHRLGKAFDCTFRDVTTEEVRDFIRNNPLKFDCITGMELGTPHLHFDCRNREGLMEFWP